MLLDHPPPPALEGGRGGWYGMHPLPRISLAHDGEVIYSRLGLLGFCKSKLKTAKQNNGFQSSVVVESTATTLQHCVLCVV